MATVTTIQAKQRLEPWRVWVIVLLVAIASAVAYGVALVNQNLNKVEEIVRRTDAVSVEQSRFRDNFSNYMNCLIVNEEEVVIQVGEEAYVEICKQLLYLGIDPVPKTIKADPSLLTTTTTTTR